jgi:hypothetical protein
MENETFVTVLTGTYGYEIAVIRGRLVVFGYVAIVCVSCAISSKKILLF